MQRGEAAGMRPCILRRASSRGLQRLEKDLGIALQIVQRLLRARQLLEVGFGEALLYEPVRRLGG